MERVALLLLLLAIAIAITTAAPPPQLLQQQTSPLKSAETPFTIEKDADRRDRLMHPSKSPTRRRTVSDRQAAVENENVFWLDNAQEFVARQLVKETNRKIAKNVILFMGDGMSTSTQAAARAYIKSEETKLAWEHFPSVGMAKTYAVDYQVADSSSTATAYLSGIKNNYGTVGVSANVPRYSCTGQLEKENQVPSIAKWALDAGKSAGLVTTSAVTDASPSVIYAHSANRYWENDVEVRTYCDPSLVPDITRQLIEGDVGERLSVIMGGGREQFRTTDDVDEEGRRGLRADGRNLIDEWLAKKAGKRAEYVWNATDLRSIDASQTDYVLGLFEYDSLKYNREVLAERSQDKEPLLHEMTRTAIEILSKNEEGFFLFVEGGKIDSAHHANYAQLALDETAELSKAVAVARSMLSDDDTLIVLTADHSHVNTYNGYADRGADVTGVAGIANLDDMHYMTLSYANGPGFSNNMGSAGRIDSINLDTSEIRLRYPSTVPLASESHGGDDVTVYATGPWSHLFNGNYEQNVIPHIMAYASCMNGSGPDKCPAR